MSGVKARAKTAEQKSFLMPTLREQLDARQPLYRLGQRIAWEFFEKEFGEYYSEEGRPAKPVRLMVGLLWLKQMFNLGDETARPSTDLHESLPPPRWSSSGAESLLAVLLRF
jgi:hypothetical protein